MDRDHFLLVNSFAMGWLDFFGRCESLAIEARSWKKNKSGMNHQVTPFSLYRFRGV
jgi:hypothetical protein